MKNILLLVALFALLLGGLAVATRVGISASSNFGADLSGGSKEVLPADSVATGWIKLELAGDGSMINFQLRVSEIMDVTQAHIHIGPAGSNGPIAVWLVPTRPPATLEYPGIMSIRASKVWLVPANPPATLIRGEVEMEVMGTITAVDLVGPLAGKTLDDLVAEFAAGNAYINVHTGANPLGEIRGQIMAK